MNRLYLAAAATVLTFAQMAFAQTVQQQDLESMSVEDLLDLPVNIASRTPQTLDEAPSIVSVITDKDIATYGARDAVDILRMVPGFEFATDVESISSIGFRGIWVHEGKVLLMLNGIMLNDLAYGNVITFGSLPAAMVDRVEIIRGPGSALYGGFAEVTVINFITRPGAKLQGIQVRGNLGMMTPTEITRSANVTAGVKSGDFEASVDLGYSKQPMSARTYDDFFGGSMYYGESNSAREWWNIVGRASYKGFSIDFQKTSLTWVGQDAFAPIQPRLNGINTELNLNSSEAVQLRYAAKPVAGLVIDSVAEVIHGTPMGQAIYPAALPALFQGTGSELFRLRGQVTGTYQIPKAGEAMLGGGYIHDIIKSVGLMHEGGLQLSADPTDIARQAYTQSGFVFAQYSQKFGPVALTAGGRFEGTTFGTAFAPRFGATFVRNDLNIKLLYGQAFRIPTGWAAWTRFFVNNPDLKPERTQTVEGEVGYKFGTHLKAKANVFFIDIQKPIAFNGAELRYDNFGRIQSVGFEAELQARFDNFGGFANFSYNRPGTATSDVYLTADRQAFLGLPSVKVNVGGYFQYKKFRVAPSITVLGPRYGQSADFATGVTAGAFDHTTYPSLVLANLNVSLVDLFDRLDISLVGHNIFNAPYLLIQTYYGAHAPLPAGDRQFTLMLSYKH